MYLSSDDGTLSASGGVRPSGQLSGQYDSDYQYDEVHFDSDNIYNTTRDMSGNISSQPPNFYSTTPPSTDVNFNSGGPQLYFGAEFLGNPQMYSTEHGRLAGTFCIESEDDLDPRFLSSR